MRNKKKKLIVLFSILVLSTFLLYSCYPDYGLSVTDYDTVITLFESETDFDKKTYAMPDTVFHIVEEGTPEDEIDRSKDALILSTIVDNMQKLKYERVPVDTTFTSPAPDFVLLVAALTTENTGVIWSPGWGYWPGWGWWGGYPGWGYPGGTTYQFTTGTIGISMIDPDKVNLDDGKFGGVWIARLNGVLSSSVNSNQRIKQRINDAYNQSPYLGYTGP
ncbi:MAG: DUF4136 domain-containing protein [Ignavibacterium sp.]|nr:MAG: DUF4136 domain-containing protein [Ignavibacterium sp.]